MARRAQAQIDPIQNATVDDYVTRLKNAGPNRSEFDIVIADLADDKKARKAAVVRIASIYSGTSMRPSAKKGDAVQVIKKRFIELVRTRRELEIASKTTPA